jgi:hypothetical protein
LRDRHLLPTRLISFPAPLTPLFLGNKHQALRTALTIDEKTGGVLQKVLPPPKVSRWVELIASTSLRTFRTLI